MVETSHQAGSDSLLILHTIMKLKHVHFFFEKFLTDFQFLLYGLEFDVARLTASCNVVNIC